MTLHNFAEKKKKLIIPFFIMNRGCPNRCVYCNQKISAGAFNTPITREYLDGEIQSYLQWNKDKLRAVELAFYGGSFTGLPRDEQERLLSWASPYLQSGKIESIRISTRPDYIDQDTLLFLRRFGVRAIELGAQSFDDNVLRQSHRGHDANATIFATHLIKEQGLSCGLHLMAGLPGDSREIFMQSLEKTIELSPATVRIHPTLVLSGTKLADAYISGHYLPLSLSEAVFRCLLAWEMLTPAGIRIIRFGLQITPEMSSEGAVLAGPLHPAFGSLVYSAIFLETTLKLLADYPKPVRQLHFIVSHQDLSNFRGHSNSNVHAIKKLYPDARIVIDSDPAGVSGRIILKTEMGQTLTLNIPGL